MRTTSQEEQAEIQDKTRLLEHDVELLKEYGFKKRTMKDATLNLKKIDQFGMRQLYRLKLLLLRNESLIGSYPPRVQEGIKHNDLKSFAEALSLLSAKLQDLMV